jgi:hypothetical protein
MEKLYSARVLLQTNRAKNWVYNVPRKWKQKIAVWLSSKRFVSLQHHTRYFSLLPRASERTVLLKVEVCYTFSHVHIFTSSLFTFSQTHTFTSSHLLTFTYSHLLSLSLTRSFLHETSLENWHIHIRSIYIYVCVYIYMYMCIYIYTK